GHFRWLGANLLCSVKFTRMPIERILERVRLENFEDVENCFRQKQPFVLFLSHIGSWEFCTRLFPHFAHGQRTATVYQRIRNPYIDRHVREARGRFGLEVFERSEGFGEAIESLTARANEILEKQVRRAPEDWFWVHNRWKTPRPNFLLVKYKRGVFLPENASLKPFRILIRSSNWLGDAVMSVPAVRAIKKGRPDAHVTILAPKKIAPMWKLIQEVDEILSLPNKSLFNATRLIARQARFDVAILFP